MTKPTLDQMLEAVCVLDPGAWENDIGPKDWYAVATEDGIIAYFGREEDAFFFRLALVNAQLHQPSLGIVG